MATVLYVLAEVIRNIALILQPIMPDAMAKVLDMLKVDNDARTFEQIGANHRLATGIAIDQPQGVFPRYVEKEEDAA